MAPLDPILEARRVEKFYLQPDGRRIQVLAPTDLAIYPNEIVVLLSPSGSGKSTLLRMLTGLDDLLPIIEAAALVQFIAVHEGSVQITAEGRAFAEADILARRVLFRQARKMVAAPSDPCASGYPESLLGQCAVSVRESCFFESPYRFPNDSSRLRRVW